MPHLWRDKTPWPVLSGQGGLLDDKLPKGLPTHDAGGLARALKAHTARLNAGIGPHASEQYFVILQNISPLWNNNILFHSPIR